MMLQFLSWQSDKVCVFFIQLCNKVLFVACTMHGIHRWPPKKYTKVRHSTNTHSKHSDQSYQRTYKHYYCLPTLQLTTYLQMIKNFKVRLLTLAINSEFKTHFLKEFPPNTGRRVYLVPVSTFLSAVQESKHQLSMFTWLSWLLYEISHFASCREPQMYVNIASLTLIVREAPLASSYKHTLLYIRYSHGKWIGILLKNNCHHWPLANLLCTHLYLCINTLIHGIYEHTCHMYVCKSRGIAQQYIVPCTANLDLLQFSSWVHHVKWNSLTFANNGSGTYGMQYQKFLCRSDKRTHSIGTRPGKPHAYRYLFLSLILGIRKQCTEWLGIFLLSACNWKQTMGECAHHEFHATHFSCKTIIQAATFPDPVIIGHIILNMAIQKD